MFIDNDITSMSDSIKAMVDNRMKYIVVESKINNLGYDLLNLSRLNDAIAVFTCNTQLFPNSANTFDSLGEAYMVNGQNELAIINYEKALTLEPDKTSAINALKKLKRKY